VTWDKQWVDGFGVVNASDCAVVNLTISSRASSYTSDHLAALLYISEFSSPRCERANHDRLQQFPKRGHKARAQKAFRSPVIVASTCTSVRTAEEEVEDVIG
jgi:hypothetical protein